MHFWSFGVKILNLTVSKLGLGHEGGQFAINVFKDLFGNQLIAHNFLEKLVRRDPQKLTSLGCAFEMYRYRTLYFAQFQR